MIEWKYHDARPEGFEYQDAGYEKNYSIAVSKIGDTRYTVRWYYKGMTSLKEHIDAKDWDEAKTKAVAIISNNIKKHIEYWQERRRSFDSWIEMMEAN